MSSTYLKSIQISEEGILAVKLSSETHQQFLIGQERIACQMKLILLGEGGVAGQEDDRRYNSKRLL